MAKLTLTDVVNLQSETTAVNTINANSALIETAFENTLSRDGTVPNQMQSNIDMNTNQILNLPAPATPESPARLMDVVDGATIITVPPVGTSGAVVPLLNANNTWSGIQSYDSGKLSLKGATSGNTILNATAVASGTITVPAATDTLVGRNTTDTLTNKTLTSPTSTSPTITGTVAGGATYSSPTLTTPTMSSPVITGNASMTSSSAGIDIGSNAGSNTPFIDFHSSNNAIDYDSRIIASGGSASIGQGTLTFTAANTSHTGSILSSSPTAGAGYTTGSGSQVTQITSKSTAVTINAINGLITTHNASLASNAAIAFTVNNSAVGSTDYILLTVGNATSPQAYRVYVTSSVAGSFVIQLVNTAGGALAEAVPIKFAVFKGAQA